jgi:hypothetical protein
MDKRNYGQENVESTTEYLDEYFLEEAILEEKAPYTRPNARGKQTRNIEPLIEYQFDDEKERQISKQLGCGNSKFRYLFLVINLLKIFF